MKRNPGLTKTRVLLRLTCIENDLRHIAGEMQDINPESSFYSKLKDSKLGQMRKYIDTLYLELRQISMTEISQKV